MRTLTLRTLSQKENFLGIPDEHSRLQQSRVVVLPVPYEKTSTYGKGSKKGPKAIIKASQEVELYDSKLQIETYRNIGGIATLRPLNTRKLTGEQLAEKLYEVVQQLLAQNKFVITLGGEHTSIVGAVYAHIHKYKPLTIIQFDAHSDLRDSYQSDAWNHACAMSRILDRYTGKLVQIGIRSEAPEEPVIKQSLNNQVFTFYAHHIKTNTIKKILSEILPLLDKHVYITFDCDVFDPSLIPATGTPEPGGLYWDWIDQCLETISKARRLVGFDISELSPIKPLHHPQFVIAKLIYRLLGYVATSSRTT